MRACVGDIAACLRAEASALFITADTGSIADENATPALLRPIWLLAHALRMDALRAWVSPRLVSAATAAAPDVNAGADDVAQALSLAPLLELLELSCAHPCGELSAAAARAVLARLGALPGLSSSHVYWTALPAWGTQLAAAAASPHRPQLTDALAGALTDALTELFGAPPENAVV